MGGCVDFGQAAASGAHLECLLYKWGCLGIYDPAVGDMGFAITMYADLDGLALEAARGAAGYGAIGFNQIAQAAGDIFAEVFEEAGIHPVYRCFEEPAFGPIGDVIGERDDFEATATEVGFIELSIVNVTRET